MLRLVLALGDVRNLLHEGRWLLEGGSAWRQWLRRLLLLAYRLVKVLLRVHALLLCHWDCRGRLTHIESLLILARVVHIVILIRQYRVTVT